MFLLFFFLFFFFFFLMIRRPPRSTLFPYTTPLPILRRTNVPRYDLSGWVCPVVRSRFSRARSGFRPAGRSEEHTSELQSQSNLVCRLLLEKKKKKKKKKYKT